MCIHIGIIDFFIRNAHIFANPLMLHETVLARFCSLLNVCIQKPKLPVQKLKKHKTKKYISYNSDLFIGHWGTANISQRAGRDLVCPFYRETAITISLEFVSSGSFLFRNYHAGSFLFRNEDAGSFLFRHEDAGSFLFRNQNAGSFLFRNYHAGSFLFRNENAGSFLYKIPWFCKFI